MSRPVAPDLLRDYFDFLRFPSVSTQPSHRDDVRACARWLSGYLRRIGLEASLYPTAGHPILLARSPRRAGRPTVLIYGHYDVQPPEPLERWHSPPFEPTVRRGQVFARGAMDNKGQLLCHLKAVESLLGERAELPVNVLFLIEGEEEIGSPNLGPFLRARRRRLGADVCVISDSTMFGPRQPAITYGLRGVVCLELRVYGPAHDLHSGLFGGVVANPARLLARVVGEMVDQRGRIAIPGFYSDVRPLPRWERRHLASLGVEEERLRLRLGVPALSGERGYGFNERRWARPTFEVNGLFAGYQGEGSKTIIPAWAGAKISFRLVPDQKPARVVRLLRAHLRRQFPPSVRWELIRLELGAEPYLVSPRGRWMRAAARAVEQGFGRPPVFIREGGSIPIVTELKKVLGLDALLIGFGLGEDGPHSPNEHFGLDRLRKGILTCRAMLIEFGRR